ncbi:hypothetical protein GGR51DRAFT_506171 [Nemania sp. FL0031]|nr:hypothetical protein GGR51DRAFT_506171 [Nemania sp. FL0031]
MVTLLVRHRMAYCPVAKLSPPITSLRRYNALIFTSHKHILFLPNATALMASPQEPTYTRVYSSSSARQLVSGRGRSGHELSMPELCKEFDKHSNLYNREPTALVSVSTRVLDTVRRAYAKHLEDGEPAADIWIVFIEVPDGSSARIHAAEDLATRCCIANPILFRYERVFEWEIPEEWILYRVSLQTLFDCGLDWHEHYFPQYPDCVPWTSYLRNNITSHLDLDDPRNPKQFLIDFTQHWGSEAPMGWIAYQLSKDLSLSRLLTNSMGVILPVPSWSTLCNMEALQRAVKRFTIEIENGWRKLESNGALVRWPGI